MFYVADQHFLCSSPTEDGDEETQSEDGPIPKKTRLDKSEELGKFFLHLFEIQRQPPIFNAMIHIIFARQIFNK